MASVGPRKSQNFLRTHWFVWPLKRVLKGFNRENKVSRIFSLEILISKFWPLDGGIGYFGSEIRILREISSLEPAPKVSLVY